MNIPREDDRYIRIRLEVHRGQLKAALAAVLLLGGAMRLASESMTLTTYYPSPAGIYKNLTSTHQTVLARDGGNVGIGTSAPGATLEVKGTMKVLGAWQHRAANTVYQAETDGFVVGLIGGNADAIEDDFVYICSGSDRGLVNECYGTDGGQPGAATIRTRGMGAYSGATSPIRKGEYWQFQKYGTQGASIWWIPFGN
ncbi:MAG: hypothetical protein HY059_10230 [Proteobacteria bacterium]|nr:hypothetical protein [Pseudomonadota bacterium]